MNCEYLSFSKMVFGVSANMSRRIGLISVDCLKKTGGSGPLLEQKSADVKTEFRPTEYYDSCLQFNYCLPLFTRSLNLQLGLMIIAFNI